VTLQAGLGIVKLLHQAPIPLALAHLVLAIIVFTISVAHAERLSHRLKFQVPRSSLAEQSA
jgi:cytochrome c oxidase assembly protein subunit 15